VTAPAFSDLSLLAETVARIVWGKPSSEAASQLRWGTHGSRVLNRENGVWYDHERNTGGGTLDLVPGENKDDRLRWLRERGLIGNAKGTERKRNSATASPPIIATYDYTDESGELLFQVVRLAPKAFRQRRPRPEGGWTWSLGDARRVLYRLPEVRDAIVNGRIVFIVEGEKDADNLRNIRFTATCNPSGANKWTQDYSKTLHAADVVIVGDHDGPGRAHVAQVASSVHGVAHRVRLLDLQKAWPACPPKGDISDWICAGGTAEKLVELIESLPEWTPVTRITAEDRVDDAADAATNENAEIEHLAKLPSLQYEREREGAAERLSVRARIVDRLVAQKRQELIPHDGKQGRALSLPEPEPWHEHIDGTELLQGLSAAIRQHVVMLDHFADATALWVLHSYLLEVLNISPRLAITAPEKRCGKTTLLDVLNALVWRPLALSNASTPGIFRAIEKARPTLLLDEGDSFLLGNEEMRGVLNSGHRRGGSVLRTVGDNYEPRQFETFSACAIAMIGKLPDTLSDRSIMIELQRRLPGERIEPFRYDRTKHLDELARKAARWAADNADRIRIADPVMPPGVFNRAADNWRPLLAIADLAGGEWPQRARRALQTAQATVEDGSTLVELLGDICAIFDERGIDRLTSVDLAAALAAIEGRPWAEWKAGKSLSLYGLARLLKPLKIRPGTIRVGNQTAKGYYLFQFDDVFRRYLGRERSSPSHSHNVDEMASSRASRSVTSESLVTDEKRKKSDNDGHRDDVTVAKPGSPKLSKLDIGSDGPSANTRSALAATPLKEQVRGGDGLMDDEVPDFEELIRCVPR
jgi:hypothetical protein